MQVIQFKNNQDVQYGKWLSANPSGFVVNDRGRGNYLLIHNASSHRCIKQPGKNHTNPQAMSTKIVAPVVLPSNRGAPIRLDERLNPVNAVFNVSSLSFRRYPSTANTCLSVSLSHLGDGLLLVPSFDLRLRNSKDRRGKRLKRSCSDSPRSRVVAESSFLEALSIPKE